MANEVEEFVEANPNKPYKMYAAMASAFLTSLLLTDIGIPTWGKAIISAVVAALAVYLVKSPLRAKKTAPGKIVTVDRFLDS